MAEPEPEPTEPARPSRVRRAAPRIGKVLLWGLVVAVLVLALPAAAKQWTDRKQEDELKNDLIAQISTSSADAFAGARGLVYLPSGATTSRRLDLLNGWTRANGPIDAAFRAYLPRQGRNAWGPYRDALFTYLRLACCENISQRHRDVGLVKSFVVERGLDDGIAWDTVERGQSAVPARSPTLYADAYDHLGRRLLLAAPIVAVRKGDLQGLSAGWRDFAHDAVPGW